MSASTFLRKAFLAGHKHTKEISPIPLLEALAKNCGLLHWHQRSLFYRSMIMDIVERQGFDVSRRLVAAARLAIAETKAGKGIEHLHGSVLEMKKRVQRDEYLIDALAEAEMALREHALPSKRVRGKRRFEQLLLRERWD